MTSAHPCRDLSKRLSVLCEIGKLWNALSEIPAATAEDNLPIGYHRILEARIVREFLAERDVLLRRAMVTGEFRKNFASFDLSGSEGYVMSLAEGGFQVRKILLVSYLGRFQTLLALAKLLHKRALELSAEPDLDSTVSRRPR